MAWCQAQPIDLVLTELRMPQLEGLATMQALWAMTPSPTIIALSDGGGTGSV